MRQAINIVLVDEAETENEIKAFNEHERHFYEEALSLLSNENSLKSAGEILWLRSLGKEFLKKTPSKSDVTGQLADIQAGVKRLQRALSAAVPKTQYLLGKDAFEQGREDLEKLGTAAEKALAQHNRTPRNEFMGNGYSAQDEFIGFCLNVFEQHRPGVAAKYEENDFHYFCQAVFSLLLGCEYESSLMGSINKIL